MAKAQRNILILNGPNLNMLGVREPEIYGSKGLGEIAQECETHAGGLGLSIEFRQSNIEGELVTMVQQARGAYAGVIVNGGGYAHTSVALLDALRMVDVPVIEVHISNVHKREPYRRHSYISETAQGVISGFGGRGYILALDAMNSLLADAA